MYENIRSALAQPLYLSDLHIQGFDVEHLDYFMAQVKGVASQWTQRGARILMSEALERVPILTLVPHAKITRSLQEQCAPEGRAFIVDLFGYQRGVFTTSGILDQSDRSSSTSSRSYLRDLVHMCRDQHYTPTSDFDAYRHVLSLLPEWERTHGVSQHDILVLRRARWGDGSALPSFVDAFTVIEQGSEPTGLHELSTWMFDIERHRHDDWPHSWSQFVDYWGDRGHLYGSYDERP